MWSAPSHYTCTKMICLKIYISIKIREENAKALPANASPCYWKSPKLLRQYKVNVEGHKSVFCGRFVSCPQSSLHIDIYRLCFRKLGLVHQKVRWSGPRTFPRIVASSSQSLGMSREKRALVVESTKHFSFKIFIVIFYLHCHDHPSSQLS